MKVVYAISAGILSLAAAIAWLSPFPPGRKDTVPPSSVSPTAGRRSLCMTISMLRLPQTTTRLMTGHFIQDGTGSFFSRRKAGLNSLDR